MNRSGAVSLDSGASLTLRLREPTSSDVHAAPRLHLLDVTFDTVGATTFVVLRTRSMLERLSTLAIPYDDAINEDNDHDVVDDIDNDDDNLSLIHI